MIRIHKVKIVLGVFFGCISSVIQGMQSESQIKSTSYKDDTLCWAAFHGNVQKAKLLLEKGCKLQIAQDGSTPLHTAAYHNNLAVLTLLLTYPYYLPEEQEVKAQVNQCSVEQLAKKITITHFARLKELLSSKTIIVSVPMTPYEAAWEKSDQGYDSQCRQLLDPTELQTKLSIQVTENYQTAIKKIVEKATL